MEYRKIESEEDINALVNMAGIIWNEHFSSMFEPGILQKLISDVQSKEAILSQLNDDYQYFFILEENEKIGYFAYKIDHSSNELFLSKIYILSSQRGKGIGKKVLTYLEGIGRDLGVSKISLTVYHKNFNSIKAYEKWGFKNLGLIKRYFDSGLVFDDVKMERLL